MSPKSVNTHMVLATLKQDPDFIHCYLSNARKQIYSLEVEHIDEVGLSLTLKAPGGRLNPICPDTHWELTFRDKDGVYQASIKHIETVAQCLVFTLKRKLSFLARRKNIRFAIDSRNPIAVVFKIGEEVVKGSLIDLSLDGLGIHLKGPLSLNVGDIITQVQFELRSFKIKLVSVPVAHMAYNEGNLRVGVRFDELSHAESKSLRQAINMWYMSQSPSFSGRKEA